MSEQTDSDERRFDWRAIWLIAVFIVVVTGISALLSDGTTSDLLGRVTAAFILCILGVLSYRYQAVHDALEIFLSSATRFFVWTVATLAPLVFFNWLSNIVLTTFRLGFQIAVFVAWGLLLAFAIQAIATPRRRDRLFGTRTNTASKRAKGNRTKKSKKEGLSNFIGNPSPVVYAIDVLLIATIFFSSITFVLLEHGVVQLDGFSRPVSRTDEILELYIWHFLDAIPLLKVNETLQWKQPLTYPPGFLGFIILLFKVTVILPVIAAFSWYWKQVSGTDEPKEEVKVSAASTNHHTRPSMSPHLKPSSSHRKHRTSRND